MREVHRSAIVPYPADAMYALVADLEAYPLFVPGCTGSSVLSRDDSGVLASLSLSKGPFVSSFTTRNSLVPPCRMTMELVDGPFQSLHGEWLIEPLGEKGCRIDLRVRFRFSSAARDWLLGPAFELTCNGLVDAFVARAKTVYG
ncbi:MAG: type II toxin-antitoxin system RatA family toxin [Gammaproteobacteria bacterium]|nr:type II toxin-antitoxin system RatA family toxin [Gammaproteobacteria bacterium]